MDKIRKRELKRLDDIYVMRGSRRGRGHPGMKKLLLITAAFLIFASVALYSSQKAFSGPEEHSSASSATGNVKDLALELESRQAALQEREKELTENEQHLKEREKALDEKIKQLTALRESITGEIEVRKTVRRARA